MFTEETVKTSNKLLLTTISLELELIELSKVKVLSVLPQHGILSTGEPFLVMEELSMALKKEEMEDHYVFYRPSQGKKVLVVDRKKNECFFLK